MKVKMLKTVNCVHGLLKSGTTTEVPGDFGKWLIETNRATESIKKSSEEKGKK